MSRFLSIAVVLSVAAIATARGGGGASTTPEPTTVPTPSISLEEALRSLVGDSPSERARVVLAVQMTAQEASNKTAELGLNRNPQIKPDGWECPEGASCPYPGEPADEIGYLIIVRHAATPGASSVMDVTVKWVTAEGGESLAPNEQLDLARLPASSPTSLPTPTPINLRGTNWHLEGIGQSRVSILVETGNPGCYTVEPVQVAETDAAVTILAFTGEINRTPDPTPVESPMIGQWHYGVVCTAEMRLVRVVVELANPLGARILEGCTAGRLEATPVRQDCRATLMTR
jgi:hypothetical protein